MEQISKSHDFPNFTTVDPLVLRDEHRTNSNIIMLHGFTQNSDTIKPFAHILAEFTQRRIQIVDLPGHGKTIWTESNLQDLANAILATFGKATYIGYSLGGRILFHLATSAELEIEAVVTIGAHPGIEDTNARAKRLREDLNLAQRISNIENEKQTCDFIDEWVQTKIFSGLSPDEANVRSRYSNSPHGLSSALANLSLGVQADLRSKLSVINFNLLYIYGERDSKFAEVANELQHLNPKYIKVAQIANAGHYVIGQKPYITAKLISDFISSIQPS